MISTRALAPAPEYQHQHLHHHQQQHQVAEEWRLTSRVRTSRGQELLPPSTGHLTPLTLDCPDFLQTITTTRRVTATWRERNKSGLEAICLWQVGRISGGCRFLSGVGWIRWIAEMYVNWTFRPQWDANQARALINVTLSTTTTTITIATTIITITY